MMENPFKLVVFDLDGTLAKPRSGWMYFHSLLGTEKMSRVSEELYFSGKIGWHEWAERDAKLWKGAKLDEILAAVKNLPLNRGAKATVKSLRKAGYEIAIISAGLNLIGKAVASKLGISRVYTNELIDDGKKLTGEVKVNVTDTNKGEILRTLLEEIELKPHQVIAVGDDFTMIPLFKTVGLSIAYNPLNSLVEEGAKIVVKNRSLTSILPYILNFNRTDST